MAVKKTDYTDMELVWLENKMEELKAYCDKTPIDELKDRVVGNKVTANIEAQVKCIRETLHEYIKMKEALDKLREREGTKKPLVRGNVGLSPLEMRQI